MRLGHWLSVMILASSVAAAPACSDDDDTTGAGGSGGTGGSGTAGRGGAGQGGAAGSSGRGPDAAGGTGGSGGTGGAAGAAGSTGGQAGSAGRDGGGTAGSAGTAGRGGQTADAGDAPDAITLTDGQIVGVVHAANLGEIQAGMLAETRAVVGDVRTFATRMDNEHTAADRALLDLAADAGSALTPTESPLSNQLTATAMQKLQALQPLQGIVFDRAYMNDQVEMHSQVLTLLNDLLIPSAMNAALRTQLMTVRESVMMHLAQARLVQQAISSDAGDGGDGAADAADGDVGADGDGRDGATDADAAMDVSDDRMGDGSDGG